MVLTIHFLMDSFFLTNRIQAIKHENYITNRINVLSGVSQE